MSQLLKIFGSYICDINRFELSILQLQEEIAGKCEKIPYSELDPKTMKIQNLRDQLTARGLSSKGLKPQLIARLAKALNAERLQGETKDDTSNEDVDMDKSENAGADGENADDGDGYEDPADVDMNDIVVLDEYDATKPEETKSGKKDGANVLDEKERRQLERRYTLPESPHIVVHPSKTAKSGKFDCAVQSLSVLLDYRPEDTKEHSFEVSLFAELFNEMLMRDFGFTIYKEVAMLPEKPKDAKDESTKKKEETAENNSNTNDSEKGATGDKAAKDTDGKHDTSNSREKSKEARSNENEKGDRKGPIKDRRLSAKRPRDDDSDEDDYSIKSGERKRRPKMVVAKPDLLLSFIYFDTTHCGYIFEKDVEELFYIIGLNLSRAQVRKLLGKVVSRDAFYYRKLTDKPKEENPTEEIKTEVPEASNDEEMVQLAKGNKSFLPVFKSKAKAAEKSEEAATETTTGMVSFNGSLIDVGKLIEQMKRSERGREETEEILNELRKQNAELQSTQTKSTNKIKDLQSDVKSLSRKLSDTESSLSSITRKNNEYYSILSSVYDRVSPLFSRSKDREKEREKEKERDREQRDKSERDRKDRNEKDKDDVKDAKPHVKDSKDIKEEKTDENKSEDKVADGDAKHSGSTVTNNGQESSDKKELEIENAESAQSTEKKDDTPQKK